MSSTNHHHQENDHDDHSQAPTSGTTTPNDTATTTTTTTACRGKKRKAPFQLIERNGRTPTQKFTDAQLIQEFVEYNRELANLVYCKDGQSSWNKPTFKKCKCLEILLRRNDNNGNDDSTDDDDDDTPQKDLFLYAVATFQLQFGNMSKREQQIKVMDWMRYALNSNPNGNERNKQLYLIPYLAPDPQLVPFVYNLKDLTPLFGHYICQQALQYLLGIGKKWWTTSRDSLVDKHSLPPIHAATGRTNPRRLRFLQEEEADLRAFMDSIQDMADPTPTKKRNGQAENVIYYLNANMSKRYCYKLYCAQRGKSVKTTASGITTLEDLPNFGGEIKKTLCFTSFNRYWGEEYPKLRHKKY